MIEELAPSAVCPCCGAPMSDKIAIEALEFIPVPKMERELLEYLIRRHPRRVSIDQIIEHTYGADPNGGPTDAANVISVRLTNLRRRLATYGWTISSGRGSAGQRIRMERCLSGEVAA